MHWVEWIFWGLVACVVPMEIWRQRDIPKRRLAWLRVKITEIVSGSDAERAAADSLRNYLKEHRTASTEELNRMRDEIYAKHVTDKILTLI